MYFCNILWIKIVFYLVCCKDSVTVTTSDYGEKAAECQVTKYYVAMHRSVAMALLAITPLILISFLYFVYKRWPGRNMRLRAIQQQHFRMRYFVHT
ncbi:unnamed protein product [Clavelina lepadiformis]|uniref:G-protein coupled receptors family 1 profile domain-containing protein n=1 Tax=Clavelina lepadiformis TaxID=159417 RepID=A0ABP0G9F2_CLALP